MKPNAGEDAAKSKSSKKSTKSRSKSSKSDASNAGAAKNTTATPPITTPTTPYSTHNNPFEAALSINTEAASGSSKSHHKSYFGLEPRSIKIIWEQHDQSDVELSTEVCARLAEDATYKLWEVINNVKIYARHSGGVVTYDLVNEVLRDADVPPALGAMDSDWDRIDYDGSFYFYLDKIVELRDEYQKDVSIELPAGADFVCSWPVEDKHAELLKKYIPSLVYVAMHGDADAQDTALAEAASSPIIGCCYRVILSKLIQMLAFKQTDAISLRCWRFLSACAVNPCARDVHCREEYFHLSEILICQLLAPFESIKVHAVPKASSSAALTPMPSESSGSKMELDDVKLDIKPGYGEEEQTQMHEADVFNLPTGGVTTEEKIYKLQVDDESDEMDMQQPFISSYFATPVDWKCVNELCEAIGQLAAINGYFQAECLHHILRRMERFFEGRYVSTEREFNYISRAVRGLIALGEFAFREFIPYAYKFKVDDVPETLWKDFALGAVFLNGPDDIYLYEWLESLCGADKLQPFMLYYAQYHEKLLTFRYLHRKPATYKINSKLGVRRLEWNSLAAAMCHGDDPNRALKPKPSMAEVFPELIAPNLQLNCTGTIRFKFAGCRPVIIKPKTPAPAADDAAGTPNVGADLRQSDILIARRKLFKPLTDERRVVPLSSYYFARI